MQQSVQMSVVYLLLLLCMLQLSVCLPVCGGKLGISCMENRVVSAWSPSNVTLQLAKVPDYDLVIVMRSVGYSVDMSVQTANGSFVLPTRRNASIPAPSSSTVPKFVVLRRQHLLPGNYTVHFKTNSTTPTLVSLRAYVQTAKDPLLHPSDQLTLALLWRKCCEEIGQQQPSVVCNRITLAVNETGQYDSKFDICRQPPNICSQDGFIQHLYLYNEEPDGQPGLTCKWEDSFLEIFLKLSVLDLSGNNLAWKLSDLLRADLTGSQTMTVTDNPGVTVTDNPGVTVTDNPGVTVTNTSGAANQPVQLVELYLQQNKIKGGFGATPSPTIEVLWGAGNRITGSIPSSWLPSEKLAEVILDDNLLMGEIPQLVAQEGVQLGLRALHLAGNKLQGTIPDMIAKAAGMVSLDLSGTNLVGSLPPLPDSIQMLNLGSNKLSGNITSLDNNTQLVYLSLGSNRLSGLFPAGLATASRLQVLNLTDNAFSGRVDVGWNGSSLAVLQLWKNDFEGPLPVTWANLPALQILQVSGNKFSGNLNAFAAATSNRHAIHNVNSTIRIFNVSNNQLTGSLPPGLQYMDVFAGERFSELCAIRARGCPHIFDVTSNQLSGPFPTWMLDVLPQISSQNTYTLRIDADSEQEAGGEGGNTFYCPAMEELTEVEYDVLDLTVASGLQCTNRKTGGLMYLTEFLAAPAAAAKPSETSDSNSRKKDKGAEARYIVGLVFGCLLVAAAVVAAILLWFYRTKWYNKNAFQALHEVHTDIGSLQLPQSTSPRPIH